MRKITRIIIHCTATKEGREYSVKTIEQWHKSRGFKKIGYHYVIHLDGAIEQGREEEEIGAHCQGYNANSIGIAYVGGYDDYGMPKDTRTDLQKIAMRSLVGYLLERYPDATVCGHNDLAAKYCPCFDVKTEL